MPVAHRLLIGWNPDILVDTHVSDGADYAAHMTLISSAADKQTPTLGTRDVLTPEIFSRIQATGDTICPYVDTRHLRAFPAAVSFRSWKHHASWWMGGPASLHQFITESHMLKPFPERVNSTTGSPGHSENCGKKPNWRSLMREGAPFSTYRHGGLPLAGFWTLPESGTLEFLDTKPATVQAR